MFQSAEEETLRVERKYFLSSKSIDFYFFIFFTENEEDNVNGAVSRFTLL